MMVAVVRLMARMAFAPVHRAVLRLNVQLRLAACGRQGYTTRLQQALITPVRITSR